MFYLHGKAEERPPVSSLLQALLLYVHQVRTPLELHSEDFLVLKLEIGNWKLEIGN